MQCSLVLVLIRHRRVHFVQCRCLPGTLPIVCPRLLFVSAVLPSTL